MNKVIRLFEEVRDEKISPNDAYYKLVEMQEDIYSTLAKENNLKEVGCNIWQDPKHPGVSFILTKMGFQSRIKIPTPPKERSLLEKVFG